MLADGIDFLQAPEKGICTVFSLEPEESNFINN